MKNTKASKAVTIVISALILVFAGLIIFSLVEQGRSGGAAQPSGAPGPGGAPAGGQVRVQGGGQTGGSAQAGGSSQGGGQAGGSGRSAQSGAQAGQAQRNAVAVRATPVVLGTVENSVIINGDVLARSQVSIYPTVAGKLTERRLQVGDRVSRGQVVAMVDPSKPGEVYSQSPVVSTISGTVLQAPAQNGDTVSAQTAVYVVGDLSGLSVETFVPERFSTSVRRGLSALVALEAMPAEIFSAVLDEVSPVLDPASRTVRVRLAFTETDPRIKAGMFATVSLVTQSRIDVPVIPRASVINTYGSWIVFVVNQDNLAERREITLGLESESFVEVTGGLLVGDMVVTAGQNFLSDKEPVRLVP